jgi:predicted DNA-binding transcriptional regulator AlpA
MNTAIDEDDLLSIKEVCRFFTGEKHPIDPSTVYRWVKKGKIPPPIRISPALQRWRRSELEKIRAAMYAGGR